MALNTDNQENGSSVTEIVDSGIDAKKLFVGGLSGDTEENDIKQYFSKFGETESIRLKIDPVTGNSEGFAFVVFKSANSMDKVFETTEHNIKNKKVDVAKAKAKQGKIFVTGLSVELQDEDIKKYFAVYGSIVDAVFPFDTTKGVRKPFCFITFGTEKSANDVLKKAKHLINNHEVIVKKSINKKNFNQSPGNFNFIQNKFNGNNGGHKWQANRFNATPRVFTNNVSAHKNRGGAIWLNKNNGGNFNANRNFHQNQGHKWQGPNNSENNYNAGNNFNTGNNYNVGNKYNPRNNYNAEGNYNTDNFNESYDQNQGGGKWRSQNNRFNNGGFNARNRGFNQNQGEGMWQQNQNNYNAEKFHGNRNCHQNQGGNQWQNQNNYDDSYNNGYFTESGGNNQNGAGSWQNRNNVRGRPY